MPATYNKGDLLEVLHDVEPRLPLWLSAPALWKTLDVDYEEPRVERLWIDLDGFGIPGHRLYLHRIHPCEKAFCHPHPWPSAIRIVSGRYEMDIGDGLLRYDRPPPVMATVVLGTGSEYEMIHPNGWHSVRPIAIPSLSVMVSGPRWDEDNGSAKPTKPLNPLTDETRDELLQLFSRRYR